MIEEQSESVLKPVESKPARVVLIASEDTFFCYSMQLEYLLDALANESIPAVLVCPKEGKVFSQKVEVIQYPTIEIPLMGWQNNKLLIEQLEKFKPTILHCLCQSKLKLVRQLADRFKIPYVVSINSFQGRLGQLAISSRNLSKIIVPCESIAVNIAKVWPRFADSLVHINPGALIEEKDSKNDDVGRVANMVTFCHLEDAGEFECLLNAIRHLIIDGQEFMLVVISDGSSGKQFRKLVASLGLSQVVTVADRPKAWPAVTAVADIFIQARPTEEFNPFLLEAMSEGAVAAGCKGGVDDLIIDEQTGLVFDPDDELSIYSVLQRLLDSRELSQKLSSKAHGYLRENYGVSSMTSEILKIYRQG